jgi:PAS domain S-box-containing protein
MTQDERLTYLGEILVALAGTPVPSQQFQTLADHAPVVLACDYLGICLIAPDGQGYLIHSLLGLAGGAIPNRLFDLEEGSPARVIAANKAFHSNDIAEINNSCPDFEGVLQRLGLTALLVVPLRQGNRAIGALVFASNNGSYQEPDLQIGKLLAAGLSAALETTRLYQMLSDERSTLAAVLGSTQDAVLVVNEEGIILLANPAVSKMFNLEPDRITGQPLTQVVAEPILLGLFTRPQPDLVEVPLPHNGGTAQASLVRVTSEYGEPIGWAAVFRDITLLKELEQMKNEFVATVSHDLKNPIGAIRLAADLLQLSGQLNEHQIDIKQRIVRTAEYMNEMVSDLLDLGKIEAGLNVTLAAVNLSTLINEAVIALQTNAASKQQIVTADLPDELLVYGDGGHLRRVWMNLIGNAIKYTPELGEIKVWARVQAARAEVFVQDNGLGIPAKDLPYLFDKFYRVSSRQTRHIEGTGLGLAIVKSIVESHNGRIMVSSQEGVGSTFHVVLPLCEPDKAGA